MPAINQASEMSRNSVARPFEPLPKFRLTDAVREDAAVGFWSKADFSSLAGKHRRDSGGADHEWPRAIRLGHPFT